MGKIAYTVTATLPDQGLASRYVVWLRGGHVAAVVAGGAESSSIVVHDAPASVPTRTVEVRYIVPSRAALDGYLTQHAPRLRAEGLTHFGPQTGVVFGRTVGEVLET